MWDKDVLCRRWLTQVTKTSTDSSFSLVPHALGVHAACRVAMPKDNGLRVRSGTKLLLHRGIVAGAALGARQERQPL